MKKILLTFIIGVFVFLPFLNTNAQNTTSTETSIEQQKTVLINFFFSPTCSHCKEEMAFLGVMQDKYPELSVNKYNVFDSSTTDRLKEFFIKYDVPKFQQGQVPVTFINDEYFIGFGDSDAYDIEYEIQESLKKEDNNATSTSTRIISTSTTRTSINIPFYGKYELSDKSPLILAIVLGTLDGFNACAMVALGFLLAVLIATKMRKKVLLVGGVFIFVSGLVYFLFISAWLNLMIFLSAARWISVAIGIVTIVFALFMLKDYVVGVVCKICQINPKGSNLLNNWQKKLFTKMSYLTSSSMPLPLMLLGVALVAAGINTVELFCSFGFPLAFTNFLTTLNLPTSSYYTYLLIYVLFYMIDDFIIFLIALATLRITKMSDKYLKFIMLISSVVLLLLGIVMIMKGF